MGEAVDQVLVELELVLLQPALRTSRERLDALRSSLWRREAGCWRMMFHQGTPLPAADNIGPPQDAPVPALPA
jgi:hypothetical protein